MKCSRTELTCRGAALLGYFASELDAVPLFDLPRRADGSVRAHQAAWRRRSE